MALDPNRLMPARAVARTIDADVFLYNGPIKRGSDLNCIEAVHKNKSRDRALLLLVTDGGSPDAAYKITRYFQEQYDALTVLISGMCKSAGTLIAVGATDLAFAPFGELGPLDIQMSRVDRLDSMQSGLTIQEALDTLEARALSSFYSVVGDYIRANNGLISFATAAKAGADFVTQLYTPVLSRIDPEEVGTRSRSMRIAIEYGKRLAIKWQNPRSETLSQLAEKYPAHSFVIDRREAEGLFHRARAANAEEMALIAALGRLARFQYRPQNLDHETVQPIFDALSEHRGTTKEAANDGAADHEGRGAAEDGRNPARADGEAEPATAHAGAGKSVLAARSPGGGARKAADGAG